MSTQHMPSPRSDEFYADPTEHTQAEFDAMRRDAAPEGKTLRTILHERLTVGELEETICFWCGTGVRAEDSKYCGLACEEADRFDNITFGED